MDIEQGLDYDENDKYYITLRCGRTIEIPREVIETRTKTGGYEPWQSACLSAAFAEATNDGRTDKCLDVVKDNVFGSIYNDVVAIWIKLFIMPECEGLDDYDKAIQANNGHFPPNMKSPWIRKYEELCATQKLPWSEKDVNDRVFKIMSDIVSYMTHHASFPVKDIPIKKKQLKKVEANGITSETQYVQVRHFKELADIAGEFDLEFLQKQFDEFEEDSTRFQSEIVMWINIAAQLDIKHLVKILYGKVVYHIDLPGDEEKGRKKLGLTEPATYEEQLYIREKYDHMFETPKYDDDDDEKEEEDGIEEENETDMEIEED
jgi:hypothetical protein